MTKALEGEHYCGKHQGNTSYYATENCTLCKALADIENNSARICQLDEKLKDLESTKERLLTWLIGIAYRQWRFVLVTAESSQKSRDAYERMSNPKIGDLVMEVSSIMRSAYNPIRIGRLQSILDAPTYEQEEWEDNIDEHPIPLKQIYVLETLVSDLQNTVRWENCKFITLSATAEWSSTADLFGEF